MITERRHIVGFIEDFYPLLVLRCELVCAVIMIFLITISRLYRISNGSRSFEKILWFGFGHIIFDIITVLTVNLSGKSEVINLVEVLTTDKRYGFTDMLNWICHIIFYIFALLFLFEFFCYIVNMCFSKKVYDLCKSIGILAIVIYAAVSPFLEMDFIDTQNGTHSSYGVAAFVGYGLGVVFIIASFAIVLFKSKDQNIRIK